MTPKRATVYLDRTARAWRYRVVSGGHNVDPSEGYTRRRDAVRAIRHNRPDVAEIHVCNRYGVRVRTIRVKATLT
jgi:hypothetical protein